MGQESRSASVRRDPEQIRAEIENARAEIADSLLSLRDEVSERLDWRNFVQRRPFVAVGMAFAVGYLLGRR
ncbi:DUF3618 domain-containing protein [Vulgatibacter sp.]|uniref:DUF3618 domain-containing protein n=1 Tax=Vulgatibacter sp. TaxID=1971226 RepID=UPI003563DF4B